MVEGREECDSASGAARIEMVPRIVSLLRAQYVPSYVPPILLQVQYRSLPLPAGTSSVLVPNRETIVSYPILASARC